MLRSADSLAPDLQKSELKTKIKRRTPKRITSQKLAGQLKALFQ
jgi:hypothetical protein